MRSFQPTTAPPGRLVRLGVVLDTRNPASRLREIARMCERAGIDALWVNENLDPLDAEPRLEAWAALTMAVAETERIRVGVQLRADAIPVEELAAIAADLNASIEGRFELSLCATETSGYVRVLREYLQANGPRISIEARTAAQVRAAVDLADDVCIPAASAVDVKTLVGQIRKACEEAGRHPATLGIALDAPISIGRTSAEAQARADAEPLFSTTGHPEQVGIFGTLERCQDRVIRVAHDGVTELRCRLPNTPDVHDVIAQLTAMVMGSVEVLTPDAARSPDPEPPQGWGGRSPDRLEGLHE